MEALRHAIVQRCGRGIGSAANLRPRKRGVRGEMRLTATSNGRDSRRSGRDGEHD